MKVSQIYKHKGKDAFGIIYTCNDIGDKVYDHNLIVSMPGVVLDYLHYRSYCRMTPDYKPSSLEVYRMMEKLSNSILEEEKFNVFHFPEFLLIEGEIEDADFQNLLKTQEEFKFKPDTHLSSQTNSMSFAGFLTEFFRFKLFEKRKFELRFSKISRKVFEKALIPGRMGMDYIELHRIEENEFYTLIQNNIMFYFLCNNSQEPLMVIARNQLVDS